MNVDHQAVASCFEAAMDLEPARRAAFLAIACDGKEQLRLRVENLILAHGSHAGFLNGCGTIDPGDFPPEDKPGDTVGNYQLMEKIGEGGCGVVFAAEQQRPIRRRVALKLVRPGMGTREVLSRFAAEQQVLARLDHPYIAKVFDAGTTPAGRPFFVMEWVAGTHLTGYCREHRLPTRERLELFVRLCRAVEHAHRTGIVHRDLKPSNILVSVIDGVPIPRIIDFGIAKATDLHSAESRVRTQTHQFLGTPAYASPEQLAGDSAAVDHRTDIFSLGILLYELLVGSPPTASLAPANGGNDAPSVRLGRMAKDRLAEVAREHGTEPLVLIGMVRGTLDRFASKAAEARPADRYATAGDLADDIARHLEIGAPLKSAAETHRQSRRSIAIAVGLISAVSALVVLLRSVVPGHTTLPSHRNPAPVAKNLDWGRFAQSTVWTGAGLVVWGGASNHQFLNDGWIYDPASGASRGMPREGAPSPRANAASIWTGEEILVWGGDLDGKSIGDGASYDPSANIWRPLPSIGAPVTRITCCTAWTGNSWFLWGGQDPTKSPRRFFDNGALFDSSSRTWTPVSRHGAPSARTFGIAIWTGNEVVVWGGLGSGELGDGAAFDPKANAWRPLPIAGAPPPRHYHTGVWTGREVLVWGGNDSESDKLGSRGSGARYDPVTDRWAPISDAGSPASRWLHSAVWTGTEMLVWGGAGADAHTKNDGAAYDPAKNRWRALANYGAPAPRIRHSAVWTGTGMIIWGGAGQINSWTNQLGDGAIYDPVKDRWAPFPPGVP